MHLARLVHLGEIVEVTVPGVEQEAARDLVRAREDVRGDLMSSRHRVGKLLLRQGIVYYGGNAWTARHETWLRSHRFDQPALQMAFDSAFEAMRARSAPSTSRPTSTSGCSRFNRRNSRSRGLLFHTLLRQAVDGEPVTYKSLRKAGRTRPAPPPARGARQPPPSLDVGRPELPWRARSRST